ncbi:MAG: DUF5916 domain-containing protein [Gemmatimonadota bacterium]
MHAASRLTVVLLLLAPGIGIAQTAPSEPHADRPRVRAIARTTAINLDGVLDEAVWAAAPVATSFIQHEPSEGQPASQQTEVRFVYDEDALYIAARMYDDKGKQGVRTRLVRRDQINEGDNFQIIFDTYHDHSARTIFMVNPSGVKYDAGQASPSTDASWDPVWDVATAIDEKGWTAELRIPFAQLRFPKDSVQTWGMQLWRYTERLNEISMWSFWGKKERGGPQHFGHLEDIRAGQKRGGLELLPYVVGKAAYEEVPQGSPFHDASDFGWRAGGDVKALLTSTLTLDATINPDFGQVEVDPAVVNLSAFETSFEEKRPFFVSGRGVFGFGGFNCFYCSNVSSLSLFYSRRIGRSPQGFVSRAAAYTLMPDNTTIMGAAKITGRTQSGLQLGILNALTSSEKAKALDASDGTFEEEVEPLTNYFVGRVKKNYRNGDYTFGAIGTSVIRRFDNPVLEHLVPAHAEAAGVDWNMGWKKRMYSFMGNFAVSNVNGDRDAILRLQHSSARYFQRPDRQAGSNTLFSDRLDSTMTTMRGFGGYARVAKDAGDWLGEAQVNYRSPGFEVNDLAFLTRADYKWMNGNIMRAFTKPTKYYRRLDLVFGGQQQYNFDGDLTDRQAHFWAGGQTSFLWWMSGSLQYRPEVFDDRLTRGGVVVKRPTQKSVFFAIDTDSRKPLVFGIYPGYNTNAEGGSSRNIGVDVRFKPATNLSISLSPYYDHSIASAQFVRRFRDESLSAFFGQRAVFAEIEQRTLELRTRVSATFTPTLTLEVVLQPFIASGDYRNFKEFVAPRALAKRIYGPSELSVVRNAAGADSVYVLRANGSSRTFEWQNPDFNFRSLRGNAVLRWEYRPGSTLFLVWQQQRSGQAATGDFRMSRDLNAIFDQRADNIFLVKVSYWLMR